MKKTVLKLVSGVILMAAFSLTAVAQSFEGIIEFRKTTTTDTINYLYYVKDNFVRIDEIGSRSQKVEGSFLVNLDAKTMKSVNHERKLYMDQPTPAAPALKGSCTVTKGQNVKNLQGYKCNEQIVTNNTEGVIITYYLAEGKFNFFDKLLRQLNRKDKASVYYLQIPETKGMFPMLSIQTDLKGKETGRLEVTKITKKPLTADAFDVPKGYNKFEK
ncbi:MAG: DUF4412 domain-containing protein [Bacteroidia bacterium]